MDDDRVNFLLLPGHEDDIAGQAKDKKGENEEAADNKDDCHRDRVLGQFETDRPEVSELRTLVTFC